MTTELTMLAWTSAFTLVLWLPYILAHIAKYGPVEALSYRADGNPLPGWAERARKAHHNAIENLAPFAAIVLVAHAAGVSNEATAAAAQAYFWLRVAHFAGYVSGLPLARTLTFAGAWLAQLCILYHVLVA